METVEAQIRSTMGAMATAFGEPVFDEWALIRISGSRARVLAYEGPRDASFRDALPRDIGPLKAIIGGGQLHVGDIDFAHEGTGQRHDAVIMAGEGVYLVCNHTQKALPDITRETGWRSAQKHLVELADWFREHPVQDPA